MNSQQAATKAKDAWKSVKEMLEEAEQTVHKELQKAVPVVQKSLDGSLVATSKAFASTMNKIETKTESEQLGLLRAYKMFLSG